MPEIYVADHERIALRQGIINLKALAKMAGGKTDPHGVNLLVWIAALEDLLQRIDDRLAAERIRND